MKIVSVQVPGGVSEQQTETVRRIGEAIQNGAAYLPIRNLAAALASRARPKDYKGQAKNVYNYIIDKWRYVRDPARRELVSWSPEALYKLVLAGDGRGVGAGRGAGDCDCIAAASGALFESIGFPVRLATTAPPGAPGRLYSHVFMQTDIPGVGWTTIDPVGHPHHGFGWTPPHARIAYYDLDGQKKGDTMDGVQDLDQWTDYGLGSTDEPDPWDWRQYGLKGFGSYAEEQGLVDGAGLGLVAEVEYIHGYDGNLYARTPMLEITPDNIEHIKQYGTPYDGMLALGDLGEMYIYDGTLGRRGWFKRLRRKIKKRVRKVAKKIGRGVKKLVKKLPGGKYLIKLGKKLWKVSMKLVKPLIKYVGKYATKLAPVAALIPGVGPAIAAAMYTSGRVAKLMKKYSVALKGKKGKLRQLKFPGGDKALRAKAFKKELERSAAKEVRKRRRRRRRAA